MAHTNLGATAPAPSHFDNLEATAESIALAGCSVLAEVSAFCSMALDCMENPGRPFRPEALALLLETMQARVDEQRDFIVSEAENIGVQATGQRAAARLAARAAMRNVQTHATTNIGA